jgi:hypothetical protein
LEIKNLEKWDPHISRSPRVQEIIGLKAYNNDCGKI